MDHPFCNPDIVRDNEGNDTRISTVAYDRKTHFEKIRDTVRHYIESLDVPFVDDSFDQTFYNCCLEKMIERSWSEKAQRITRTFLPAGLAISRTAYAHLPNLSTRIFIALYTSVIFGLDDIYAEDKEKLSLLKTFTKALLSEQLKSYGDDLLDAVADLLRQIPGHFGDVEGGLVLSSTLRYLTSIVIDSEVPRSDILQGNYSKGFPRYLRDLSGAPDAYSVFIFPPSVSYTVYIKSLPDINAMACYTNDILSIYKEELAGEEGNFISLLAAQKRISKSEAHKRLTEETLERDRTILRLLEGNNEALGAYKGFRAGFVAAHTSLKRYRLRELLNL